MGRPKRTETPQDVVEEDDVIVETRLPEEGGGVADNRPPARGAAPRPPLVAAPPPPATFTSVPRRMLVLVVDKEKLRAASNASIYVSPLVVALLVQTVLMASMGPRPIQAVLALLCAAAHAPSLFHYMRARKAALKLCQESDSAPEELRAAAEQQREVAIRMVHAARLWRLGAVYGMVFAAALNVIIFMLMLIGESAPDGKDSTENYVLAFVVGAILLVSVCFGEAVRGKAVALDEFLIAQSSHLHGRDGPKRPGACGMSAILPVCCCCVAK